MARIVRADSVIVAAERGHVAVEGFRGLQHLVGHLVQEGRLHAVGLLCLIVSLLQFLTTLLELAVQVF